MVATQACAASDDNEELSCGADRMLEANRDHEQATVVNSDSITVPHPSESQSRVITTRSVLGTVTKGVIPQVIIGSVAAVVLAVRWRRRLVEQVQWPMEPAIHVPRPPSMMALASDNARVNARVKELSLRVRELERHPHTRAQVLD